MGAGSMLQFVQFIHTFILLLREDEMKYIFIICSCHLRPIQRASSALTWMIWFWIRSRSTIHSAKLNLRLYSICSWICPWFHVIRLRLQSIHTVGVKPQLRTTYGCNWSGVVQSIRSVLNLRQHLIRDCTTFALWCIIVACFLVLSRRSFSRALWWKIGLLIKLLLLHFSWPNIINQCDFNLADKFKMTRPRFAPLIGGVCRFIGRLSRFHHISPSCGPFHSI